MKYVYPAVMVLLLAGCANQDMGDLRQFVDEVKARPSTPIEPIPQIKQAETYLYVGGNRRNPFVPTEDGTEVMVSADTTGPRPDPNRRKEELESFPLDALKMVGTLDQKNAVWALVQSPEGTIHRVKSGNYLGQNDGRIVSIEEEKINVLELIPNGSGGYLERQASLALGERD
ncbi:MAG TPA: pilus assembly protein PilP [Chromatiaceae bacterium]|nr:pilus assembly protein PilP [Chromatiaceae bacterium]